VFIYNNDVLLFSHSILCLSFLHHIYFQFHVTCLNAYSVLYKCFIVSEDFKFCGVIRRWSEGAGEVARLSLHHSVFVSAHRLLL